MKTARALVPVAVLCAWIDFASIYAETRTGEFTPGPQPVTAYRGDLDLILYGGIYTDTSVGQILGQAKTDYKPSYLSAVALNFESPARLRALRFETEGQIVQHQGLMNHQELNGVLVARWHDFMPYLPMSVAFGEGLSYATERPPLENREIDFGKSQFFRQESNQWLNYFYVELDWRLPLFRDLHPRLLLRLHHRSGVFGTYCEYICGSNFITYGVKLGL